MLAGRNPSRTGVALDRTGGTEIGLHLLKTYLACALGISACQSQHTVAYFRMDDLARRLVSACGTGIAHQKLLNVQHRPAHHR
ncbi:ATP-binding protein [Cryobacterium zhongshanensis]|uniref:ATP-binding protein n=1 Tax=Cryobacterium zhongshanensis TaxID=2928153 RepID=UPI0027E0D652|nr:ATP-binding protein [Cryobacterium zhongshanensis]